MINKFFIISTILYIISLQLAMTQEEDGDCLPCTNPPLLPVIGKSFNNIYKTLNQ